jgi:hypothetical protein
LSKICAKHFYIGSECSIAPSVVVSAPARTIYRTLQNIIACDGPKRSHASESFCERRGAVSYCASVKYSQALRLDFMGRAHSGHRTAGQSFAANAHIGENAKSSVTNIATSTLQIRCARMLHRTECRCCSALAISQNVPAQRFVFGSGSNDISNRAQRQ